MWNTVLFSTPCESSLKVNRYVFTPLIIYNFKLTYIYIYIHIYLNESLICTFSLLISGESPSVVMIKNNVQSERLKAKCWLFSHSCMAETCKNNIVN